MRVSVRRMLITGLSVLLIGLGAYTFTYTFPPYRIALLAEGMQRDWTHHRSAARVLRSLWLRAKYDRFIIGKYDVGDMAPNVRLVTPDGQGEVHLRDLLTDKLLVLIFGSYT